MIGTMSDTETSKYKYLAKNTLIFSISNFGSKILTFLLVPLYTYVLSTSDYGTADAIITTSNLLVYVFTINIADAVLRFTINKKDNQGEILSYGIKVTIQGTCLLGFLLLVSKVIWPINWPYYCYGYLFAYFAISAVNTLLSNYLRSIDRVGSVAIAGIISTVSMICCNVLFLVVVKIGLVGYLLSLIMGPLIAVGYQIICVKKSNTFQFRMCDKAIQKEMRSYSIPLIFNNVCWWINNSLDRYLIIWLLGTAQNGIYSVAYKIPTILSIFQSIFSQAWSLSAIKEFDSEDKDGFFSKTYEVYNTGLVFSCALLILFNVPLAKVLFVKDFFEAWQSSSILLLASLFTALGGFLGSIFSAIKKTKVFAVSTLIAALINVILNYFFIPTMGIQGAAIATVISFFVMWLIRITLVKKEMRLSILLYKHIISYVLLLTQIVVEHLWTDMFLFQIVIVVVLVAMYWRLLKDIVQKLVKRLKRN